MGDITRIGRPPHTPTDESRRKVRFMVAIGILIPSVAAEIGVGEDTLRKYYPEEILHGRSSLIAEVAGKLVTTALTGEGKDALLAQMFFLKTQGGWRETDAQQAVEVTVIGGFTNDDHASSPSRGPKGSIPE